MSLDNLHLFEKSVDELICGLEDISAYIEQKKKELKQFQDDYAVAKASKQLYELFGEKPKAEDDEAIRAAKRQYHREWRKNHPENVRAAQERFLAKKKEETT